MELEHASFGVDLIPVWLNARHVYENDIDFYIVQGSEILDMKAKQTYLVSPVPIPRPDSE